jgi:type III restriction enzyme
MNSSHFPLKTYQRKAVDELKDFLEVDLKHPGKTITFKAPTGSGKTLMASALFEEFLNEHPEEHICIIWATIGTAELQIQSYDAVSDYLGGSPTCSLINTEFFGSRTYIKNSEIVFVNWEKLVDKDVSGKWINDLMKDQEGHSFLNVLDETRRRETSIVLVVDESHVGSGGGTRITEFKEQVIKANVTINMSATPKDEPTVSVDPEDVIAEGMIKEDVVLNEGIVGEIADSEIDSQTLVMQKAYQKRLQLLEEYKRLGSTVNPLMLIQIPNVDEGEKKKEFVRDFLRDFNETTENGKVILWCDKHDPIDRKYIKKNDCPVDVVIFKTAVAIGWDCPRASILVKFREGHSETFEIQTVGRILRTAEHHSYPDSQLLNHAYIYTNIKEYETKADSFNPNKIKVLWSRIPLDASGKMLEHEVHLMSFYRSRQDDYNAADSRFTDYLLKNFETKFGLTEKDRFNPTAYTKLQDQGFKISNSSPDTIMSEKALNAAEIDKQQTITSDQVEVKMADSDIENEYYKIIFDNLSGLAFVRSKSPINSAIIEIFNTYLTGMFPRDRKLIMIQQTVLQNEDIFRQILLQTCDEFKNMLIADAGRKGKYDPNWIIEAEKGYPKEGYTKIPAISSLYQPLYLPDQSGTKAPDKLEVDFINYVESKKNGIKWFWKNGDERAIINFGIPYNNGTSTFQPDWLIKFVDGTIGVFDTKPIAFNVDDTKVKAEALNKFLCNANSNRATEFGKVIGGIIVKKNGIFYYSDQAEYVDYDADPKVWKKFDDVFDDIDEHILEIKANQPK